MEYNCGFSGEGLFCVLDLLSCYRPVKYITVVDLLKNKTY